MLVYFLMPPEGRHRFRTNYRTSASASNRRLLTSATRPTVPNPLILTNWTRASVTKRGEGWMDGSHIYKYITVFSSSFIYFPPINRENRKASVFGFLSAGFSGKSPKKISPVLHRHDTGRILHPTSSCKLKCGWEYFIWPEKQVLRRYQNLKSHLIFFSFLMFLFW